MRDVMNVDWGRPTTTALFFEVDADCVTASTTICLRLSKLRIPKQPFAFMSLTPAQIPPPPDVAHQRKAYPPFRTVARVDAGGAVVDAHGGAHDGLQALVLKCHLLTAAEVVAGGLWWRRWLVAASPRRPAPWAWRSVPAARSPRKAASTPGPRSGLAA